MEQAEMMAALQSYMQAQADAAAEALNENLAASEAFLQKMVSGMVWLLLSLDCNTKLWNQAPMAPTNNQ
ncbi:MAG: hypothetical protein CM1200mP40_20830 [Gammaproteobacteria bacterium]|nr:MAG: hypothetical protein CM1200mP40_20830 [Gammaproteobacteria bacterium]